VALKLHSDLFGTYQYKQGIIHKEQGGNALMKRSIKVIKKDAKNAVVVKKDNVAEKAEVRSNSKQTAREMVSTVANWVTDFQQRKRVETKSAIEQFFPRPRPTES
jgi:hypothetical protein